MIKFPSQYCSASTIQVLFQGTWFLAQAMNIFYIQ